MSDPIFLPNVRELFCISAVTGIHQVIESDELLVVTIAKWEYWSGKVMHSLVQDKFIYGYVLLAIRDDRLGNLGVLAMQGFSLSLNVDERNFNQI